MYSKYTIYFTKIGILDFTNTDEELWVRIWDLDRQRERERERKEVIESSQRE